MKRLVSIVTAGVLVVVGGLGVWWFGQGTEAPSVDVTAPPVDTTAVTVVEGPAPTTDSSGEQIIYALTDASRATFTLTEELRGQPTTVVGTSTIVLGEMLIDADAGGAAVRIGTILVNARDFTTDSGNRNRAIRGPILDADRFEFIEFTPVSVDGEGESFTVTGDLAIRGVTHPVTFDVSARLTADRTITGTATAVVDRTDWGLSIPRAPGVAQVSEDVTLTLDFVAAPSP